MTLRSAAQIEQETEATRARVSDLLEELRDRISPGVIVDQVLGYTEDGAGKEFVQVLGDQARRNPLACAIIGVGVAWLMMSDRRTLTNGVYATNGSYGTDGSHAGNGSHLGSSALRAAGNAVDAVSGAFDKVSGAFDKVSSVASDVGENATAGYAATSEATRHFADQVKGKVMSIEEKAMDMARQGRERINQGRERLTNAGMAAGTRSWDLLTDQPLVTAGIGLAVGAALGAMLPSTETEDELLGTYSDELKEQAQEVAGEQFEKIKSVAGEQFEKVKSAAEEAASATKESVQKMSSEMLDDVKADNAEDDAMVRQAINETGSYRPTL
jgi:ElaB/YqjD/DUF883 family membrane-anchored ribosome-binding protein